MLITEAETRPVVKAKSSYITVNTKHVANGTATATQPKLAPRARKGKRKGKGKGKEINTLSPILEESPIFGLNVAQGKRHEMELQAKVRREGIQGSDWARGRPKGKGVVDFGPLVGTSKSALRLTLLSPDILCEA